MAQSNFEERIDTYEIESTNVMTGDRDRIRYLYYQLKMSMAKAKQIDIIVSFLMESGVRMLLNDMKRALDRGVRIRILTGNYLGITQPSALYLIKSELGDRVDLRLYNETSRSFGFGTTALPGMAIANPAHHGYINYIIAHAIAITIGFVCTVIFGKMWSAPDKNKNDKKNDTKENDTTKAVITEEPGTVYAAAEGTVKDIEASTDPTFANKVLGDGVVIFPEDGTVMAPCKATVSLVYPTGHAIGFTTADGAEILIHCGVDTVNMNGEGFPKFSSVVHLNMKAEKILENQKVIKTPIVRNGKQATVGYQPDIWKNWK